MKKWLEKLKSLFDRRPPYCKHCKREETRQEYVEKWQCSICYKPLISAKQRDTKGAVI